MLLAEPPRTPFDLNFQVFGFPVRVHPLFWLIGFLLGPHGGEEGGVENGGIRLVIWFAVLFASILIHEFGHALMIRRFGRDAHIVLYAMGGLAIEGRPRDAYGSPWSLDSYTGFQPRPRTPNEQIFISAAGPGIQFLLAAIVGGIVYATGGQLLLGVYEIPFLPWPVLSDDLKTNVNLHELFRRLLEINILWPLMNLLPILPLDGGQIALQLFIQRDPWAGTQRALWVSVITGGLIAGFALLKMHDPFMMMLFASLAVSSYVTLQQMGGGRRPW